MITKSPTVPFIGRRNISETNQEWKQSRIYSETQIIGCVSSRILTRRSHTLHFCFDWRAGRFYLISNPNRKGVETSPAAIHVHTSNLKTYNSAYIKFVLWFNTCNCQYTLKHKIPLTIHVSLCSSTFETTHTLKCPMISIHLTREKSKLSASRFYVNIISVHIYAQLHMYISILISMIRRSLTVTWVLFKI